VMSVHTIYCFDILKRLSKNQLCIWIFIDMSMLWLFLVWCFSLVQNDLSDDKACEALSESINGMESLQTVG